MAYTTPEKVKKVLVKLPTRSIDDDFIMEHIEKAETVINSYLGGVFKVPFLIVPDLIQQIATDLAIFFVAESLYSSQKPNLDEYQETRYDRALSQLEQIVSGDLLLIIDGIIIKPYDPHAGGFATTNSQQIFNYEEPYW